MMRLTLALMLFSTLAAGADTPARKDVLGLATRVADWQLAHMNAAPGITSFSEETYQPRSWQKGSFWVGMTRLADISRREAIHRCHSRQWSRHPVATGSAHLSRR